MLLKVLHLNGHKPGTPALHEGEVPVFVGRGPAVLVVSSGVPPRAIDDLVRQRYPEGVVVKVIRADDRSNLPCLKGTGNRVVRALPPKEAATFRRIDVIAPQGDGRLDLMTFTVSEMEKSIK